MGWSGRLIGLIFVLGWFIRVIATTSEATTTTTTTTTGGIFTRVCFFRFIFVTSGGTATHGEMLKQNLRFPE